jgi:hypothetical protein
MVPTVRSFPTHGQQSAAQGSSTTVSRSDIRLIRHFDSSALMVRRWRLIGFSPSYITPSLRRHYGGISSAVSDSSTLLLLEAPLNSSRLLPQVCEHGAVRCIKVEENLLVAGAADGRVRAYDLRRMDAPFATLRCHDDCVNALAMDIRLGWLVRPCLTHPSPFSSRTQLPLWWKPTAPHRL